MFGRARVAGAPPDAVRTDRVKAPEAPDFGPSDLQSAANVSRETLARLKAFVDLLGDWNARHNLVSRSSLAHVWLRHVWDSAQLDRLIPAAAGSLVDLGSGAGFPGLVLAILRSEKPGFRTVLYEATRKKCDFLAAASARVGVKVEIRNTRIENARPESFEIVTARALAPLDRLLALAHPFQGQGTINLFLKGQSVGDELTQTHKSWNMKAEQIPSLSDASGAVLRIRELSPV